MFTTPRSLLLLILLLAIPIRGDEIAVPSGAGAGQPFLTASGSDLLMSWVETSSNANALKFARLSGGQWSAPQTVAEGAAIAANWANFPSVAAGPEGTVFVSWLQKNAGGHHAVDLYLASSTDGGTTWSKPLLVNRDNTPTEHGFAAMVPVDKSGVGIIWLDGRQVKHEGDGDMMLRYARIGTDGVISGESVIDGRVCECCGTSMKATRSGLVAVYRDRSPSEDRDISALVRKNGKWSKPALVHKDGWNIKGCPVNGPQLASLGDRVAAAWFTAAGDKGRVKVAFSNDGGAKFGPAVNIDEGAPSGRVDVVMLDDGSAVATWIDGIGDASSILSRRVFPDGRLGPAMKIAATGASRATGFPRTALIGDRMYVAWTDPTAKRVRVESIAVNR